jgi:uncharacterized membrane protein
MAIGKGWLPLYSIAAAFAIAGIQPDVDDGRPPAARHTMQELARRTMVPRIPSLVFAVVSLFCFYQLGRSLSGGDTAWSALVAAAFGGAVVWFGWQAHYYSATLALSGLSGLAVWKLTERGTWRDAVAAGLALMLLFHTHWLSFLILTGVLLANAPLGPGRPRWVPKLLLTAAIAALGIVPWLYWTNVLEAAKGTPMAWPLLAFPSDFVAWFVGRKGFMGAIGLVLALALLSATSPRQRFARRVMAAAASDRHAFYFALTWFAIAYSAFIFLSPAADFVNLQLTLVLAVPGYLLFALCVAVAARAITPRLSVVVAPLVVLAFLGGRAATVAPSRLTPPSGVEAFLDVASRWTLEAGTKIYAWPDENVLLTYISGLPVQSVAPVRKAFLDQYPGDVIFVETGTAYADQPLTEVRTIATGQGVSLSVDEARQVALRVQRHGARQYLEGLVADIWPPSEPIGTIDRALIARYAEETLPAGRAIAEHYRLLRGWPATNMMTSHWLPASYWFVSPEQRVGDRLNYRDRIRRATGIVLPNGSIIFDGRRNRAVPLVDQARYLAILRSASTIGS